MKRTTILFSAALALSTASCGFFANLTGSMGAGAEGIAFATNMEKFTVESIDMVFAGNDGTWCPGTSGSFTVTAQAFKKKKPGEQLTLETAAPGASAKDARGKMDLTEFAMEGRGGTVANGVFTGSSDSFATLMGFDVRATYRTDKTKVVEKHFDPVYSCIGLVGSSGASGGDGEPGQDGGDPGGAGGGAGQGAQGSQGPRVVAHVTIVRTPKHERVGLIQVSGDVEQITLFDLSKGITVAASGGTGGQGGRGGDGGTGADPQGAGGPGGPGGMGGPGGDGGEAVVIIDDRYPELASIVGIDVSGGSPGSGGPGGGGGDGGPAPEKACDDCDQPDPGPDGAPGGDGPPGSNGGQPGRGETRQQDVTQVFASLPPGVRLLDDARPQPVEPPPPPADTSSKKKRRR
jgi:hypothetical protein